MLNFDNNHLSIDGDIDIKKGKSIFRKLAIYGLTVANLLTFSGCEKTMPCDIDTLHAHYYVSDDDLGRYIVSEKNSVSGLKRTDKYVPISDKDKKLLDFENKNGLFKISDNQEVINNITNNQKDCTEYRYRYYYLLPQTIVGPNGQLTVLLIPHVGHSWTTDTNKFLTGETRQCHHVYYGYKVIENEKGDFEVIRSEAVDSISDLPEGYDYVKQDFYAVVNAYNKKESFEYEDGPEEGKEIITEEEYVQSQGKSR